MPTSIETAVPEQLTQASLQPRGRVQRSPDDWRDQVFYFLLPDRFSDGQEGNRSVFDRSQPQQHGVTNWGAWIEAGKRFQGGTLRGVLSKLDYLQGLGVTTLWLGPVWKRKDLSSAPYRGWPRLGACYRCMGQKMGLVLVEWSGISGGTASRGSATERGDAGLASSTALLCTLSRLISWS